MTQALAPVWWGLVALAVVLIGAFVTAVQPDVAEVYLPGPKVQLVTVLAALIVLVLVVARSLAS